jgi:hypothetical protein
LLEIGGGDTIAVKAIQVKHNKVDMSRLRGNKERFIVPGSDNSCWHIISCMIANKYKKRI